MSYLQSFTEAARVGASVLTPGITTLAAAITSAGVTSASISSASGFPSATSYYIMVDSEQMQVTAGMGTATWTVTRGTNGTTAATHLINATVFQCATSLLPIEPTFFEPIFDRYDPALMRNSFAKFYESQIVATRAELKGIKAPATFETLTNYLSYAVKGGVVPTTADSHAYTWAFTNTLTADDLAGLGAEMGNDTAAYHIAALYCDQFVLDITRGTDSAQVNADFLGQQVVAMGAKTPGITRTGLNMLNPANASTYLDSTTIGTTLVNDIASAKFTIKNGFQQLYFLNGQIFPTGAVRPTRNADLEVKQWFDSATELANAMASSNAGTERKVRFSVSGPAIPASSTPNSLAVDWYGYYDKAAFAVDKDVWMITYTGRSVYDTGLGNDWTVSLVNSLAAIP